MFILLSHRNFHTKLYRTKTLISPINKAHFHTIDNKLCKNQEPLIKEKFVNDIQKFPLETYSKFYANQFNASYNNDIISKIITDIDMRLKPSGILSTGSFENYRQIFSKIKEDGINLLDSQFNKYGTINPQNLYSFVINYVETMYDLLTSHDDNIKGTYYTDFAKDFIGNLYRTGNNTCMFFTFKNLNEQFFINTRPLCFYPVQLLNLPDFSPVGSHPLIPTENIKGKVESRSLDFREVTFHDIGHAHVMNRQDKWLFETLNRNATVLVSEWNRNKNWYVDEYNKLQNSNAALYKAIKLYLFDIVHDRGYQFYLPILRQQLRAKKNLENIKTKIMRGDFDDISGKNVLGHIDEARDWLLDRTEEFILKDNLDKLSKYKQDGYVIKRYPDVESYEGIPLDVSIHKNGEIFVTFSWHDTIKTTTLYEIELLFLPVDSIILTEDRIEKINDAIKFIHMNDTEYVQLDSDGDVCNIAIKDILHTNLPDRNDLNLKKIEIYKLERLLKLIRNKSKVKFSVTSLPDVYESSVVYLGKDNLTIETGLLFKLNEIGIENKPKSTLKYINLDPHNRFIPENILRDSYIRYPNSKHSCKNPYVTINNDLELGIIDTNRHIVMAKAISSLLSRSIEDAKDTCGGYLPEKIVERAQTEYVSPYAISNLWGKTGNRFVLSRNIGSGVKEIIGTALISSSKDTLFFFTNKYNNLKYSNIKQDVNFALTIDGEHKWFDKFDMPDIQVYKPPGCNQLANFAIEKIGYRGRGLGKLLIEEIVKNYAVHYPGNKINHSQLLICGKGLFQIADPSWRKYMLDIGFRLRHGAETFYLDHEWDRLPPIIISGKTLDNKNYNRMYGIPQIYDGIDMGKKNTEFDLTERIPKVIELANSGYAKLQYFQLIYMFDRI